MENEKFKFLAELLGEGLITRVQYDYILNKKFKMSEILEELALDKKLSYDIRLPLLNGLNFAHQSSTTFN